MLAGRNLDLGVGVNNEYFHLILQESPSRLGRTTKADNVTGLLAAVTFHDPTHVEIEWPVLRDLAVAEAQLFQ